MKTTSKPSPFKVRKAAEPKLREIDAPAEIAEAIDKFTDNVQQARHFEAEAEVFKDTVASFARNLYADNVNSGRPGNFRLLGNESAVLYMATHSGGQLDEQEYAQFVEQYSGEIADALIESDYGAIRFNADVLKANYEAVVKALQSLPEHIVDNLFLPMPMRAKPDALDKLKVYAKSPSEIVELMRALKLKNYIR